MFFPPSSLRFIAELCDTCRGASVAREREKCALPPTGKGFKSKKKKKILTIHLAAHLNIQLNRCKLCTIQKDCK